MKKHRLQTARHHIGKGLLTAALMLLMGISLTSCYVDDGWSPVPPYGWDNTFYDTRLNGYWQLVQINSDPVGGYETNYLFFNGGGRGRYYYYDRGARYWENMAYWCQGSVSGTSDYQINIQYETAGNPTTMNYWFSHGGNTLWMQWRTGSRVQTYVYDAIGSAPW